MLNKKSIALSSTIVSNESVFLFPRNGSLLSTPVFESLPMFQSHKPSLENYGEVLFDNAQRQVGMVEPHEGAIATAAETVGGALLRQISYVRKTVVPFIGEVTSQILDVMKDIEPKEFTVTQYDPSVIIYNPYVVDLFPGFKGNAPLFDRIKQAPEKTSVELINGLKTGVVELDDALVDVVTKYGEETVVALYNTLFRNTVKPGTCPVTRFVESLVTQKEGQRCEGKFTDASLTDLGILAYFLVDSFSDNPLPGTGLSLVQWETSLNAMKLQYGNLVKLGMEWLSACSRRGQLVIRFTGTKDVALTSEDAEIVVYGPVYRQGLSQGLTPESVIGGVLDPRNRQRLLTDFLTNNQNNLKRWQVLEQARADYSRNTFLKRLSASFLRVLGAVLDEVPDDQLPSGYSKEQACRAVGQDLNSGKFYQNWNIDNDPNLFELVKQKVCLHVFTFIDCAEIIDVVENEMQNGEEDAAQAAYLAAVKYLAKWLVANFDVLSFPAAEKAGYIQPDDAVVG